MLHSVQFDPSQGQKIRGAQVLERNTLLPPFITFLTPNPEGEPRHGFHPINKCPEELGLESGNEMGWKPAKSLEGFFSFRSSSKAGRRGGEGREGRDVPEEPREEWRAKWQQMSLHTAVTLGSGQRYNE